jgi:hypothetical protein
MQQPTSHEEITEKLVFATLKLQNYLVGNFHKSSLPQGFTIWKDEVHGRELTPGIAAAAAVCTNPTTQSPFQDQ